MKKYILFFIVLVPVFSFSQTFDMIHHQPSNLEESTNLILMVNQGASSIQNIYLFSKPLNNVDFVEQEIDV
ncbi:MAG: hypothetical protein U9N34_10045, partial [Candidatus Cloacimonadota bacterium]|nr:hypothetical protein [Candidatus Cloacimonadota bacterium]